MSSDSFIGLVGNVSLLVAMVFVYDLVNAHLLRLDPVLHRVMVELATNLRAVGRRGRQWWMPSHNGESVCLLSFPRIFIH